MSPKKSAFTLIELLIVVAIIAILAAIAVPNFLEAQIRSKISRAQSDMRSMAVALEAYAVDNNRYPIGYLNIRQAGTGGHPLYASLNARQRLPVAWSRITTPVAYMTSTLTDPFAVGTFKYDRASLQSPNPFPYWYDDYQPWPDYFSPGGVPQNTSYPGYPSGYNRLGRIARKGYTYSMSSAGPGTSTMMMWMAIDGEASLAAANDHIIFAYDPTNGTISEGFIGRTNKGVFTEVNQTTAAF